MKTYYVEDLAKGMVLNGETFAVKEVKLLETKAKQPYYKVVLVDKTGDISGNIWSDNIPNIEKKALKAGKVVMVNARVEEFKSALQLNIDSVNSVDESSLDEFIEASDFDLEELWAIVDGYIEKISDTAIKNFMQKVFADQDLLKKFKVSPAAEYVHHSFRGGLMEHVSEMLEMMNSVRKFYPEVNYDMVTAGIILHDIGKLTELDIEGTVVHRTKEGRLLGHLISSFEFVKDNAKGILNDEQILQLKHVILAHHGQLDYGSPVTPATIEAMMVHALDHSSSQIRIFQKIIRKNIKREDPFSEWDNVVKTRVYRTSSDSDQDTTDEDDVLTLI